MLRLLLAVFIAFFSLNANAQFVPPVPKSVTGGRALSRTKAIPLPSAKQQWVRATSPHFVTLSGASERRTREVVTQLEAVASALQKTDPHFAPAEGDAARLLLFARSKEAAPYFDLLVGRKIPGAFVRTTDGTGTMLVDASQSISDRTVLHELVHNLLANSGAHLPMWLEEGLPEFFSTAEVRGSTVILGRPMPDQFALFQRRSMMPLADVFAVKAADPISTSGYFYAQSRAIVDWMMRMNRTAFFALLADIDRGVPSVEAVRKHFGVEPRIIEHALDFRQMPPAAEFTVRVDIPPQSIAATPLAYRDVVVELANFLGMFEATRGDANRFLESIVATEPDYARAYASMASLRARDREYEKAFPLFEKALQLSPSDPEIRLAFAEALLGNAIGQFSGTADIPADAAPRFRRARQLATEALAAGGDAGRANAVIGTSYLVETDVKPGIEALQRARTAVPSRYDIPLNLYALLVRSGDTAAAQPLYDEITARAKTPQAIFAARAVFVREQLALVNRLIAANRIEEATPVLKHLIEATPDPNAKLDLERQLMKLTGVADANRQIATYNEAIHASNAGQNAKAIAILDELLKTATDPSVIRDAQSLRAELRKRMRR